MRGLRTSSRRRLRQERSFDSLEADSLSNSPKVKMARGGCILLPVNEFIKSRCKIRHERNGEEKE